MKVRFLPILLCATVLACSSKEDAKPALSDAELTSKILSDFGPTVAAPNYQDMKVASIQLESHVAALVANHTQANLQTCQQDWRQVRTYWEQTEAFLFGPVSSENIDPGIDTWPVNQNDFDSLLTRTSTPLDAATVESLQESLKGFHPMEYILFGADCNRQASALTTRELQYLTGLAGYLREMTSQIYGHWDPTASQNYGLQLAQAGTGSQLYTSKQAAFLEIIDAMAGICEEVANGKIAEPLDTQNPLLEESPFAKNSLTDFANNMRGVRNVYLAQYGGKTGTSLSSFVQRYNRSLDSRIQSQIERAINSLTTINVPFGQAISQNQTALTQATNEILALHNLLDSELKPLVQQRIK